MKDTYKARTIFTGYKIGRKSSDLYVGVPAKRVSAGCKYVSFENKRMKLPIVPDMVMSQQDKFLPNKTFTLNYYRWKPEGDTNAAK